MNTKFCIRFALAVVSALAINLQPLGAQGEREVNVKAVVDAWNARREQGGMWRYVAEGTYMIPKGRFSRINMPFGPPPEEGEVNPPEDKTAEESYAWILDFTDSRVRREHDTLIYHFDHKEFYPSTSISTYDGDAFYGLAPLDDERKPGSVEFSKTSAESSEPINFEPYDYPVFFEHGVIPNPPLDPRKLHDPVDASEFRATGKTSIDGIDCIVLRKQSAGSLSNEEFTVEAGGRHRILAWRRSSDKSLRYALDMNYSDDENASLSGWICRYYDKDGVLTSHREITVTSIEHNPSDVTQATFTLEPPPGVNAMIDGGPLLTVKEDGTMVPESEYRKEAGSNVLLIVNVTVLAAACAAAYWYLRRKKGGEDG